MAEPGEMDHCCSPSQTKIPVYSPTHLDVSADPILSSHNWTLINYRHSWSGFMMPVWQCHCHCRWPCSKQQTSQPRTSQLCTCKRKHGLCFAIKLSYRHTHTHTHWIGKSRKRRQKTKIAFHKCLWFDHSWYIASKLFIHVLTPIQIRASIGNRKYWLLNFIHKAYNTAYHMTPSWVCGEW